jgi:hypothetical protein
MMVALRNLHFRNPGLILFRSVHNGQFERDGGAPGRARAEPRSASYCSADVTAYAKKGRLRCHKRPKSREETPKEGSDSGATA